jgi:zona occludens toxin (predicted ATPase)
MKILRMMKELFSFSRDEDFVVVDLTTKMIQSMNSKDWSRLSDKKNFMVIK